MNYEQAKPYGVPFATLVMVIQIYFVAVFRFVAWCSRLPFSSSSIDYWVSELNRRQ
jgi:hypothetical protein